MMDFFNIGFSHNIKGTTSAPPSGTSSTPVLPTSNSSTVQAPGTVLPNHVRYLICSACEQGPIGVSLSTQEFYIEPDRVDYS